MCDAAYARHVPERLCSGSVLLEALYQVFGLYLFTFYPLEGGGSYPLLQYFLIGFV